MKRPDCLTSKMRRAKHKEISKMPYRQQVKLIYIFCQTDSIAQTAMQLLLHGGAGQSGGAFTGAAGSQVGGMGGMGNLMSMASRFF